MLGRKNAVAAAVLVVGIALTAAAGWFAYRYYERVEIERAEHKTDNATSAVKLALDRVALSVSAVRAMYASDWVTPDQFVRFARTLTASESARSLAFLRRVAQSDRLSRERALAGEPGRSLGIWEFNAQGEPVRASERPEYYIVESAYVGGDDPMVGLDAASVPGHRAYIEQAISGFGLVVSDVVTFLQPAGEGVVFYLPAIDRSGSVVGVASAGVTLNQLASVASLASGAFGIAITVDGDTDAAEPEAGGASVDPYRRSFDFGGQIWTVTVPPGSGQTSTAAWLVVLIVGAGLATTVAVVAYMAGLAKTAEVAEARTRLRGMLDGLGPLAWLLSPDGTVLYANRTAVEALDHPEEELEGKPLWNLLLAGGDPADVDRIQQAVRSAAAGHDVRYDLPITAADDGEQILDLWIRPMGDGESKAADLVASAVDVTGRHEVEQTQRLLMRELDHRMKNTLQVVQAIIRRTAGAQDTVEKFEAALVGRVGAMSRAHELLAQERWLGAGMATVVGQEIRSFDTGNAIQVAGPNIRLNPKAALSIAMAIHELGTNASKYGALSTPGGSIAVTWSTNRKDGEPWLDLRWVESGGPEVKNPRNNGFGTMLIERSIAYELDGHAAIEYPRKGLECTIALPLRTTGPQVQLPRERREEATN